MQVVQFTVVVPAQPYGFHYWDLLKSRTNRTYVEVQKALAKIRVGSMHLFLKDTESALVCCECWDSEVKSDMATIFQRIIDARHVRPSVSAADETAKPLRADGSAAELESHLKSAMIGNELTLPIKDGTPVMGTWQGLWFAELNDASATGKETKDKEVTVTMMGVMH